MKEHNCLDNLDFLKIKSSDKSLKYQCKICQALYRKIVNQYNHVINEYKPYKCNGYMKVNNEKVKCTATTIAFSGKNAWCEAHLPRRIIVAQKHHLSPKKDEMGLDFNTRSAYDKALIASQENCSLSLRQYEDCKDNLCGYMEL